MTFVEILAMAAICFLATGLLVNGLWFTISRIALWMHMHAMRAQAAQEKYGRWLRGEWQRVMKAEAEEAGER